MGVPREPVRLVADRTPGGSRMLGLTTGADWTARMTGFAEARVRALAGEQLSGFVLKSKSPSCGVNSVKVYADAEASIASAQASGLFAAALMRAYPDLPIEDEERLQDTRLRASFVERVFAHDAASSPLSRQRTRARTRMPRPHESRARPRSNRCRLLKDMREIKQTRPSTDMREIKQTRPSTDMREIKQTRPSTDMREIKQTRSTTDMRGKQANAPQHGHARNQADAPHHGHARNQADAPQHGHARNQADAPQHGHPRNQVDAPRNPTPCAPKTEHARNQVGTNAADAAAARGGQNVGRCSQGGGPKAARPAFDAARHPTQDRPALPGAGHHPRNARATVASLAARVRSAPARHRAGVDRSLPGDSLLDPAGPRALHRRGGRGAPRPRWRARARDPMALAVNRVLGRKGRVVGDRYHARPLTTPRQMRTSMVYVLLNFRKHLRAPACIDPRSSGPHFSGGRLPRRHRCRAGHGPSGHLDGACRLAARGRTVAGRRTPGCEAPRPRPT